MLLGWLQRTVPIDHDRERNSLTRSCETGPLGGHPRRPCRGLDSCLTITPSMRCPQQSFHMRLPVLGRFLGWGRLTGFDPSFNRQGPHDSGQLPSMTPSHPELPIFVQRQSDQNGPLAIRDFMDSFQGNIVPDWSESNVRGSSQ